MERQQNEPLPGELSSQLVTIMTTEHYTLQMGRSMTISETNGRSSLFVGAVSPPVSRVCPAVAALPHALLS
jgi:hypothetical protein